MSVNGLSGIPDFSGSFCAIVISLQVSVYSRDAKHDVHGMGSQVVYVSCQHAERSVVLLRVCFPEPNTSSAALIAASGHEEHNYRGKDAMVTGTLPMTGSAIAPRSALDNGDGGGSDNQNKRVKVGKSILHHWVLETTCVIVQMPVWTSK